MSSMGLSTFVSMGMEQIVETVRVVATKLSTRVLTSDADIFKVQHDSHNFPIPQCWHVGLHVLYRRLGELGIFLADHSHLRLGYVLPV